MNIGIISTYRSGSGWFLRCLDTEYVINLHEVFNIGLLGKHKLKQKDLEELFPYATEQNLWIEKLNYKSISYIDISQIQDRIFLNKKHCLYKIMYEQYVNNTKEISKTINNSDIVIGLYRNNILESYISLVKAARTKIWWNDKDNSNVFDKNTMKIKWSLPDYINFYLQRVKAINWIRSYIHKNFVSFSYEEIHSNTNNNDQEKVEYIKTKIVNKTGYELSCNNNYDAFFKKENQIKDITRHFSNPKMFLKDYSKIPQAYN